MRSPWQRLRSWFARVGSDPYYASYERSLSNIQTEIDRLQAARAARHHAWAHVWARFLGGFAAVYAAILGYAAYVNRQPPGTYTHLQQAARVAPALAGAPVGWLAYRLLCWLQAVLDRRTASRIRLLENKQRKQVAELKDSTRYERTLALLQKYDPDFVPPKPQRAPAVPTPGRGGQAQQAQAGAGRGRGALAAPVGRAAGSAVNAAGSVLAQLYSRAAGSLIADDPVMLGLLREAQQQSDVLRQQLLEAEARAVVLLQQNITLKQQLGLPTEEEQAALAAWTGAAAVPGDQHDGGATAEAVAAAGEEGGGGAARQQGEQEAEGGGQPKDDQAAHRLAVAPESSEEEWEAEEQAGAASGRAAGGGPSSGGTGRVTRRKRASAGTGA